MTLSCVAWATALMFASAAPCASMTVRSSGELELMLSRAAPGEIIKLAPGNFKNIKLTDRYFRTPITLTSMDPANPAVIGSLYVSHVFGLTFQNLVFSTAGDSAGPWGAAATTPFQIDDSADIRFKAVFFHGLRNDTLESDLSGLFIRASSNIIVSDSEFSHLHNALQHLDDTRLTIMRNHFHDILDDSIRGGGSSWVTIAGNRFDSDHQDKRDTDHPDCIQFWTENTKSPAAHISITDNIYVRGNGNPIQGIFISDETGKTPYQYIKISNNLLIGANWQGISIYNGFHIVIADNIVSSYPDQISRILLNGTADVTLTNNMAGQIVFEGGAPLDLKSNGNLKIPAVEDQGVALLAAWRTRK